MANRWAVQNGNWSATSTWDGGTLPTSADDVFADGKAVTIDQNITVLSLRTTQRSGGTAGGSFTANTGITINATGSGIVPGSTTCLLLATSASVTLNGTVTAPTTGSVWAVTYSSGTLVVNGTVGSISGRFAGAINVTGTGSLTVTGTVNGCYDARAVLFQSTGTLSITGDCIGATSGISGNGGIAVLIDTLAPSAATIVGNLIGNGPAAGGNGLNVNVANAVVSVTGSVSNAPGAGVSGLSVSNGQVTVTGAVTTNGTVPAVVNTVTNNLSALITMTGPFTTSATGYAPPFMAWRIRLIPGTGRFYEWRDNTGTNGNAVRWWSPDVVADSPSTANVRLGTTYANGSLTGTLAVPPAASVAAGVPVDNTVGTAAVRLQDIASVTGAQIAAAISNANLL